MARYPKKPLSPYDPRYKMTDDKQSRPGRYELRGCRDPNCRECNSHIPREIASNIDLRPGAVNYRPITATEVSNRMEDYAMRMARQLFGADVQFVQETRPTAGREPPTSYKEARKAVEKYILSKDHNVDWDSVIGNDTAKLALRDAIEAQVKDKELYEFYGMTSPKGVLLWGPPGCGKTMFAKASATAMKAIHGNEVEILAIGGSEIQSPYVAVTEGIITSLFRYAREYKAFHGHPLVLFIDECETLLPDRTGRVRRVAPWEESQVAVFLDELDGMKELGAFVILATNQPDKIDEAILRDGRIDRKIKIERPNRKAIEHIILNGLASLPLHGLREELAFAGVEALHDPAYVIKEGHILLAQMSENGPEIAKDIAINFCLEHIVSGAMATSVASRAKRLAFQRDRSEGTRTGVSQADIIGAVREIFEENKTLEHAFALREWIESIPMKEMTESKGRLQ